MFKHKNKKILVGDNRITLDAKHHEILKKFKDEQKKYGSYLQQIEILKNKLKKLESSLDDAITPEYLREKFEIQNKIEHYQKKVTDIENEESKNEYLLKTGKILYEYYDHLDNVASEPTKKKTVETKPKPSIMKFFSDNKEGNSIVKMTDFIKSNEQNFDRSAKLDEFLSIIDKTHCSKKKINKHIDYCQKCKNQYNKNFEMIINPSEGIMACPKCGNMEFVLIDSDKPSYKEPPPEATYFAYKRINHLNEILNQIQARETTDIPQEVYEMVLNEIKKERISDLTKLNKNKVRYFLKKLNLNKYYEHIATIINKLNGLPPPNLTKDVEEKLRIMFREIQGPWMEITKTGKNFLNYFYVLHKCVELLGHDEYKILFPLLKSREKIHLHDMKWKKICDKLGWEFIKSI